MGGTSKLWGPHNPGGGHSKTHWVPITLGKESWGGPRKLGEIPQNRGEDTAEVGGGAHPKCGRGTPKPPHLARRCLSWFLPALM